MTHDQQDRLIAKALGEPEALTAEEADAIMAHPGLRQLIAAAALLKGAAHRAPKCDIEAEWRRFRRKALARRRRKAALWRAAAIATLAIGAAATVIGLRHNAPADGVAMIDTMLPTPDTLVLVVNAEPAPIAKAPDPTPPRKKEPARPECAYDDVDLALLQARLDNEIALVRAECYLEIASAKDIELPDDLPFTPYKQTDAIDISLLTAQ